MVWQTVIAGGLSLGDALVDGVVQQKLTEQWGPLLKAHMEQHLAWLQEDAGNKFVAMQVANGKLLQDTLGAQIGEQPGTGTPDGPDTRQQEVAKFMDGLARPVGMLDDAYGKVLALTAQAQLHRGNFAAYEAMKAEPDVWQAIAPEARQALLDSEPLWQERAGQHSPALTGIMTDRAKFTYAVQSGAFPGTEADRDGLLNDERQQAAVATALRLGDPSLLPPGVSETNLRQMTEEFWQQALAAPEQIDNAITKLALVSWDSRLRVKSLEAQLRHDAQALFVTGTAMTERQRGSLAVMQKLLTGEGGGPQSLAHYVEAEMATRAQALLASGANLDNPEEVAQALTSIRDGAGAHATREDVEEVADAIAAQDLGWFKRAMPWNWMSDAGMLSEMELSDPARDWLAREVAPAVARDRKAHPGVSLEAAAQTRLAQVLEHADFVAGTVVPMNPHLRGSRTLLDGVRELAGFPISQTDGNYQRAVREVLNDALQAHTALHAAGRDIKKFRTKDYTAESGQHLGDGSLMMNMRHKTGQTYSVAVSPSQVLARLKQNLAHAASKRTREAASIKAVSASSVLTTYEDIAERWPLDKAPRTAEPLPEHLD